MLDTIIIRITTEPPVIIRNTRFRISGSKGGSVGVVGVVGGVVGVGVGVGVVRITSLFVFGGGFLLTAITPMEQTLGDLLWFLAPYVIADIPAKIGVWFILIILAIPAYIVIELGLRRMQRSYEYPR